MTPVGSMPNPSAGKPFNSISPVTQTSLKANQQPVQHIGSGYNSAAKPFNYVSIYTSICRVNLFVSYKFNCYFR